jgi:hypothetical protein
MKWISYGYSPFYVEKYIEKNQYTTLSTEYIIIINYMDSKSKETRLVI